MRAVRQQALGRGLGREPGFRWRGGEVSRLEGFSDATFAFAVTLLVVSLEVPDSYAELERTMLGFPAFGICFALLLLIWTQHYRFFRRYGLEEPITIVLNSALLFVVLFYIYPLKFLFTLLVDEFLLGGEGPSGLGSAADMERLMVFYGLGYTAVFTLLVLLYAHAWQRREALELDALERFDTVTSMQYLGLFVGTALLSIAIITLGGAEWGFWAGISYGLVGPAAGVHGWVRGRERAQLAGEILVTPET